MHATIKSTTLGVAGMVLAALFSVRALGLSSRLKETLTLVFLFLTAPIGAHMIARTVYRTRIPLWKGVVIDEMKEVNIKAQVVGKDSTRGLQTPRFRLFSGETNAKDIEVFHYGIISNVCWYIKIFRV